MLAGNLLAHQFVLHVFFHLYKILWLGKSHAIQQYTQHNLHHFKRCHIYEQKKIRKIDRQQQADTSRSSLCYTQISTTNIHTLYNQRTKSQTLHNTGRLKISSQTPPKGQGRPTYRSQTGAVGLSRQASHKTRTDSAKEMREDVKSGLKCVTSRSWSQFSLFLHPNAFTSSLFIICGQLVYLKLSSAEKIYLRLSLIISTYCVIFTRFPELLRGIINNKRWENLLADAEHAHCKWLLTHSNAQMETGWVLHRGVPSSVEQDA